VGRVLQIFAEVHDLQRVWINIGVQSVSYSMAKGVGYFPREENGWSVRLATLLHRILRLRIRRTKPPLHHLLE
jgi:hypothetical protein